MSEWKALREQAGMTLAEVAEKSGYSIGTINGLELRGEGSARLKQKLREVLGSLTLQESVKHGTKESVTALQESAPQYQTIAEYERELAAARAEIARLEKTVVEFSKALIGQPSSDFALLKNVLDAAKKKPDGD